MKIWNVSTDYVQPVKKEVCEGTFLYTYVLIVAQDWGKTEAILQKKSLNTWLFLADCEEFHFFDTEFQDGHGLARNFFSILYHFEVVVRPFQTSKGSKIGKESTGQLYLSFWEFKVPERWPSKLTPLTAYGPGMNNAFRSVNVPFFCSSKNLFLEWTVTEAADCSYV